MLRTVEAEIDRQGHVRRLEPIELASACRALVVVLEPENAADRVETALLTEPALAEDWHFARRQRRTR